MNIYPVFDRILGRMQKETLLRQRGCALWFTGLSGSGKTTIAQQLECRLASLGFLTQILDGDNIRTGINKNLGFDTESREENIRRIAEVGKLFVNCGIVTLNCFISPKNNMRSMAREIIGQNDFFEIFVDAPIEICEKRDIKGLYRMARAGEIPNFTGIHQEFEMPQYPDIHLHTDKETIDECVIKVLNVLLPKIRCES